MSTQAELNRSEELVTKVIECLVIGCAANDGDDDTAVVSGEEVVDLMFTVMKNWETGYEALQGASGGNAYQASISYGTGLALGLVAASVNANGTRVFRQTFQDCIREFVVEVLYSLRMENPLPSAIEHAARVYNLPIFED